MKTMGSINQVKRIGQTNKDEDIKNAEDGSFPIIGIGGSAGSFSAFEKFFLHVPINSGMAFVIIMHMDPNHNMNLAGLMQASTSMPVIEASDGMVVEPNKIYVIPPGQDMGIHNRNLLLFKASRSKGPHMSIDYFLQSLAEDQRNYAVAIIFSGMGTDGETGVRMIKEKLGMAMVQDPDTADYKSMPETSIKTQLVDYILPPEEMPAKLIQYLNHPALKEPYAEEFIYHARNQTYLRKILMVLRSYTGHDFSLYKKNTITRRVERRIAFHQLPDYEHYVNYLRENPGEIELLFNELLIGVTKFFRDQPAFKSLQEFLYASLNKKDSEEPIRVWVAGCSTGEEAYSIAIILMEFVEDLPIKQKPKVQIFATDLDAHAIETARTGFYFSNIASEVSADRLEKFFEKKHNGFVVKKEIREMIVFAQHNLIKDAPFTRLDLLCCRNVMIYLTSDLQNKIIPIFHYSLNVHGILFLGPAEAAGAYSDRFNSLDSKWKLFERKEGNSLLGTKLDFPFHITQQSNKSIKGDSLIKPAVKNLMYISFQKFLLENHSPVALLLNEGGEILYINGKTSRYLQLNSGEAVMDIYKMIHEDLKYAVGNAVYQAISNKNRVEVNDIRIKENNKTYLVNIVIDYLTEYPLNNLLLITFIDKGSIPKAKKQLDKNRSSLKDNAVEELEKELTYTKLQLHTTIEQMETSLEELKSTNEEALTTKEEMQSLNEELMTINLQYQNKGEELSRLNNDMKNLLDNTEIGTIFLDNNLNILRFTPQVTKLFNVIESDIGRSITHIVSNFEYTSIENTIKEVIEKLSGKELEVKTKKGDWYNMRIMPYRTLDNFISGAVLTFTKITPVKSMELKLKSLLEFTKATVELFPDASVLIDKDKKVLAANRKFLSLFGLRDFEVIEHSFMEIVHNLWDTDKLDKLLLAESPDPKEVFIQHDFRGLGIKSLFVSMELVGERKNYHDGVWKIVFKNQ